MTPQRDEVKDTIRAALAEGVVPVEDANFSYGGLDMMVTHMEGDRMRFAYAPGGALPGADRLAAV